MILDFSDEHGKRHFEFCFVGLVLGGSLQEKKGLAVLRVEVPLFEKLEAISEPKPCGKKLANGEPDRRLLDGVPAQVRIDAHEYDLLYGYTAIVPWQSGQPAKYALETLDWLERTAKNGHG